MSLYLRSLHRLCLFFLLILSVSACRNSGSSNTSAQQDEDPDLITCERIGPVHISATPESLAETFGPDQLLEDTREINGVQRKVTKVFPDEAGEVVVVWSADDPDKIDQLLIWNESGPYHTKENLRVGISLRDMVRINNFLPVTFTNFYSSMDGYAQISSFNGGDIEKNYPCLTGKLDIVQFKGVDAFALEDFKNIDTVRSSDKLVQNMVVKISEISLK